MHLFKRIFLSIMPAWLWTGWFYYMIQGMNHTIEGEKGMSESAMTFYTIVGIYGGPLLLSSMIFFLSLGYCMGRYTFWRGLFTVSAMYICQGVSLSLSLWVAITYTLPIIQMQYKYY